MKRIKVASLIVGAVFFALTAVTAQERAQSNVIYINSAKFVSPLIEKWVAEYIKENPQVEVKWVDKGSDITADLSFAPVGKDDDRQEVTYVARYALLPVTARANPLIGTLSKNTLGKKDLKKLFFSDKDLSSGEDRNKLKIANKITVYSGNNAASAAPVYASYFGYATSDLRGKKISGDDIFLLNAIKKDITGVTFNNLSYLYDTKTRKLKDGIAILPLDVKKEQRELLSENNIDKTITLLEEQKIDAIPVPYVAVVYSDNSKVLARDFAKWIITEGQQYNHAYGFLNLEQKQLAYQQQQAQKQLRLTSNQ